MIYAVRRCDEDITTIETALRQGEVEAVSRIVENARNSRMKQYEVECEVLNEAHLYEQYKKGYTKYTERCLDTAKYPCLSCDKLCYKRECSNLRNLRSLPTCRDWDILMEFNENRSVLNESLPAGYICHYCLQYFRSGRMPPRCILNNLQYGDVPKELSCLNTFERVLIQRAKAFQTVSRLGTVARRKMPASHKIQKVCGSTFHLPLPLEETLKRLPDPEQALPNHGELYVLLRSIPSRSKVIWQDLVSVHKVYDALTKLKEINPLYCKIKLPTDAEELNLEQFVDEFALSKSGDSMVQEISEDEEAAMYEQYTINPLHPPRQNETATALYQMLKVNEAPLDSRTKDLDMLCFPDVYPHGIGGMKCRREVPLTPAEYVKCILQSRDSRFRLNHQLIFYLHNQATLRQISSGIYHKLRIIRPSERLTAARCLEMLTSDELEGNLTTIFSRVRNTEQYWQRYRNDLNCMTFHYGPPTWFITLSPGEWMWQDLHNYLKEINPEKSDLSVNALIAEDPISACRFIDNKFKAIFDFIESEDGPLGPVLHNGGKVEYQGRGIQHRHAQVWAKDAPIIGVNSDEVICTYISKYATCALPDSTLCPTLHERVVKFQQHKCNDYCLRAKKTSSGIKKVCRFGFPRPQRDKLHLRNVVDAIAGRKQLKVNSRLYDLPRKANEVRINDYNPAILLLWEGNMDIQFIGENSAVLNWYCTKYCTKSEKSHISEVFDDVTSTKSLASKLWNVALRSLSHRECGILEACDTLLGMPLFFTDANTTIRWVDVNMVRSRRLKEKSVIENMDQESCEIFYPSWVDSHYPNRPAELENMHLYEFSSWFDLVSVEPSRLVLYYPFMGGFLKKRQRCYLVNHYKYNAEQEPEKYYYSLLLLFKPWRNSESLMGESESYLLEFEKCKDDLIGAVDYHNRLQKMQRSDQAVREQIDKRRKEIEQEDNATAAEEIPDPIVHAYSEAQEAMVEFEEGLDNEDDVDVDAMVEKLNEDQRRVFDRVSSHLREQCSSTDSSDLEALRMFVSGCGGTGKSFLIKTIKYWVKSKTGKHVAVTAPTGISAFNVNGLTIHRLLQLPVEHGKTPEYRELSDDALKIVREKLKNLVLLIIDEISMVSHVTLLYIHLRLTEIFQTENVHNGWFGCKNILLLGDLLQLPPVFENPVYAPLTSAIVRKHTGSLGGVDIWEPLFIYDELTINMRQKEHHQFAALLGRVRLGKLNAADLKLLNERKLKLQSQSITGRLKEIVSQLSKLPSDTVCLLPTRYMCSEINNQILKDLPGDEYSLVAEDSIDCLPSVMHKVKKKLMQYREDSTQTAGLENVITVKIGCKVMLRRNIDVTLGLVNGAIGTVQTIQRSIDEANKYDSVTILFQNNQEHCLKRVSTKFEVFSKAFVIRSQFPITVAYSITIHKSQGLTLNNVLTDIGNSVFTCGQAYVALSRVTTIEGLYLINFDPRSIKALDSALLEYNRLRQKFRPTLEQFTVTKRRPNRVNDIQWCSIQKVSAIQRPGPTGSIPLIATKVKPFANVDGVSSYANSVIQCLLLSPHIRNSILQGFDGAMKTLCVRYNSSESITLDCKEVRDELGNPFNSSCSQNPLMFLQSLIEHTAELRAVLNHTVAVQARCTKCGLYDRFVSEEYIADLSVPSSQKSFKVDQLFKVSKEWVQSSKDRCLHCHCAMEISREIVKANKVIIFKLNVWKFTNGNVSQRSTSVTGVSDSIVQINCCKYKLMSAVSQGAITTKPGGQYKAILSVHSKWLHCTDLSISQTSWPRGSKGVYLLFYQAELISLPVKASPADTRTESRYQGMPNTTEMTVLPPSTSSNARTASSTRTTQDSTESATTTTREHRYLDCRKFTNNDGVSCYANCILQSLLQHMPLRSAFISSRYRALRSLSQSYGEESNSATLSSRQVRRMLGAPYSETQQQDASEFLVSLCTFCSQIRSCLEFCTRSRTRCTRCPYTRFHDENNTVLLLTIPESCRSVTISNLLTRMRTWETLNDSHCTACGIDGAVYRTCHDIVRANELLIVQLKVYVFGRDGVTHKVHVSVDDVHSAIIILGQRYTVKNIVCHHGPSALSGHYTSYHRQDRGWVLVNDTHLTRMSEPTTECDVFMLFYTKDGPITSS